MTCSFFSKQKIFSFSEKRSCLQLINQDEVKSEYIKVDGCIAFEDGEKKCDFMLKAKETEFYIELKGSDISTAFKQIVNTIEKLSSDKKKAAKVAYIITSQNPLSSTEIQNYIRTFKQKFNSRLVIKNSPYKDRY